MAEEDDMGVFITNDTDGNYFKDRYYLDGFDDSEYFEPLSEVAKYVKEIVGHDVEADFDAIDKALSDYVEEHEEDDPDCYYSFHEFKEVND